MSAPTVNETPEMKLPSHSDPRGSSRTTPTIRPAKIGSISGPPYSGLFQTPSRAAVETPTNSHLLLIQRHNRVDLRHHLGDAFLHYFSPTPEIGTFRDIINATNHTLPLTSLRNAHVENAHSLLHHLAILLRQFRTILEEEFHRHLSMRGDVDMFDVDALQLKGTSWEFHRNRTCAAAPS